MQFVKYSVLRLGLFLVVFLALWKLMLWPIFTAGLVALVIAFAVTYLFFNKLRMAANNDARNAFAKTSASKTESQLDEESIEDAYDEAHRKDDK